MTDTHSRTQPAARSMKQLLRRAFEAGKDFAGCYFDMDGPPKYDQQETDQAFDEFLAETSGGAQTFTEHAELLDSLARQVYHARSSSPNELTDASWERVKTHFTSSYRMCLEAAQQMIDDGELDGAL